MGVKGKGRKRREANFRASHPDAARLAPPPATRDVSAVPSKLRKIMAFKETSGPGQVHAGLSTRQTMNQVKVARKAKDGKPQSFTEAKDCKKILTAPISDKQAPVNGEVVQKKPKSKRKREEEELLELAEKIKAKPARTGLRDKKKIYLDKKKQKKLKSSTYEALLKEPEKEKIAFGDIVQEPPKLSFPAKAKITMKEERPASHERLRLQAIEAYRQRRAGGSRLGRGPPLMIEGVAATTE